MACAQIRADAVRPYSIGKEQWDRHLAGHCPVEQAGRLFYHSFPAKNREPLTAPRNRKPSSHPELSSFTDRPSI